VTRWPRLLVATGLPVAFGLFGYLVYLTAGGSPEPGPLLAGRPVPWLVLQGLAVTAVVATVATALAWRRTGAAPGSATLSAPPTAPPTASTGERLRLGLLLTAGAVFVPWSLYWGLLLP
jgi:hypothetical protein